MPRRKTISDDVVLAAAARAMFRKGPAEFTLADVAAAAGIAPATLLQRRIGDKRRLMLAAIARDNAAFAQTLAELPPAIGAAPVIAIFRLTTPDIDNADDLADQLLWLRQDMRDPELNRLARERFAVLRATVAARLPPLAMAADDAALLVEAQWQGALVQWGIAREGRLVDFVTQSLAAFFNLLGENADRRGGARQPDA